jgi:DNA-binding response OmpR family regulator
LQAIETGRQSGQFSLLVTDINLPDLSGTEVALALCGLYPRLPVLFMSGRAITDWSRQDRSNLKRFAADLIDFLEKPFSALELEMRVRKLIGRASRPRSGSQAA